MADFIITDDLFERGASDRGGWSREQLAIIGVDWPLKKGWRRRVLGKVISQEDAERFLACAKRNQEAGLQDVDGRGFSKAAIALAKRIHQDFLDTLPSETEWKAGVKEWGQLLPSYQLRYLLVAVKLIENPPVQLQK